MGRQPELDCLKAFCIFFMVILHTFETLTKNVTSGYHFITIIECLTGAGAFMLCMGIGSRYSRKQTPPDCMRRGFELLTIGQVLYLLRDALPNLIAWWIEGDELFLSFSLLVIQADLMTFAGFAFMLLSLVKRLKFQDSTIVLIGIGMNAFAFALSHFFRTTGNYLLDQMLGYFVITDAESYFSLCSYFVFVAFGYALGGFYLRIRDKDALSSRVLLVCGPVAIGYYLLRALVPIGMLPAFGSTEMYVMKPLTDALANVLMSVFLLALFYKLLGNRELPQPVKHLSVHINQYYCLSYLLLIPMYSMLQEIGGSLLSDALLPLLLGLANLMICCFCISLVDRWKLPTSIAKLRGFRRAVTFAAVWLTTIAVVAYVYPRVTVYATVWNNYLQK